MQNITNVSNSDQLFAIDQIWNSIPHSSVKQGIMAFFVVYGHWILRKASVKVFKYICHILFVLLNKAFHATKYGMIFFLFLEAPSNQAPV